MTAGEQGPVGTRVCDSLQTKAGQEEEIRWGFLPKYVGLEAVSSQSGWMSTAALQPCGGGRRSLRSGSVLSEVAAGWALPCPAFAFPAAAFAWTEAERFDVICTESIQEIAFLKSKCP